MVQKMIKNGTKNDQIWALNWCEIVILQYLIRPKSSEAVEKLLLAQKAPPPMSTVNFREDEEICERLKIVVEEDAKEGVEEEQGCL